MRLILLLAIAVLPLVTSTPVSLDDGFSLPSLENIESHIDNLWASFKKGYGIVHDTTVEEMHRFKIFANSRIKRIFFGINI